MPDPIRLAPHDCKLDYTARVRRGATLLDEVRPGWAAEIDHSGMLMEPASEGAPWTLEGAGFRVFMETPKPAPER